MPVGAFDEFRKVFGVDAACGDFTRLSKALKRLPEHDARRIQLVARAGDAILATAPIESAIGALIVLFEAQMGSSIQTSAFFDRAAVFVKSISTYDLEITPDALSTAILGWAPRVLEFPDGYSVEHVGESLKSLAGVEQLPDPKSDKWARLVEQKQVILAIIAVDRFCRLFFERLLLKDDSEAAKYLSSDPIRGDVELTFAFGVEEFAESLIAWRMDGVGSQQLNGLIHYWCWALYRIGGDCRRAMTDIAWTAVNVIWPRFWRETSYEIENSGQFLGQEYVDQRLEAVVPLSWWLHGVAFDDRDARIPSVVDVVWTAWENARSRMSAEEACRTDRDRAFASARFGLEALAENCFQFDLHTGFDGLAGAHRLLAGCLEDYSGRMAVSHLMLRRERKREQSEKTKPAGGGASADLGSGTICWVDDPSPTIARWGTQTRSPFFTATPRQKRDAGSAASGATGPQDLEASVTDETFFALTERFTLEHLERTLPAHIAVLALYDLPRCLDSPVPGRQAAFFSVHVPGKPFATHLVVSERGDVDGEGRVVDTAGNLLMDFDASVSKFFAVYKSAIDKDVKNHDEAVQALVKSLAKALQRRQVQVNSRSSGLIDKAIDSVGDRGICLEDLSQCDLIVIPRGMAATASIDLLGRKRPLCSLFRSISIAPSFRIFEQLYQRACQTQLATPLRVSVAGWEGWGDPNSTESKAGGMVRHLMEQVDDKLRAQFPPNLAEFFVASEVPMASLDRTHRMMDASDYMIIFGHGNLDPFGVRLSDGVFPRWNVATPATTENRSAESHVVFTCACWGGRLVQDVIRSDALSPFVDEVSLSLAFADRGPRKRLPSLVGGFIHQVPGSWAAEVVIDIVQHRLSHIQTRPTVSDPFAFARSRRYVLERILNQFDSPIREQILRGELVAAAGQRPEAFMLLFSLLSFQLVGAEPATGAPGGPSSYPT